MLLLLFGYRLLFKLCSYFWQMTSPVDAMRKPVMLFVRSGLRDTQLEYVIASSCNTWRTDAMCCCSYRWAIVISDLGGLD